MITTRQPSDYRGLRIATTVACAFLAAVHTPYAIVTVAGLGGVGWFGALSSGFLVLCAVGFGYRMLTRLVKRTSDHQLVSTYLSESFSVLSAATKLVSYVLIVALASGFAVHSVTALHPTDVVSVPVIQAVTILLLAIPVLIGWQPSGRLIAAGIVPAATGLALVIIVGLFRELTGTLPDTTAAIDTDGGVPGAGLVWPFGEALLGALLPVAIFALVTERSFGEKTFRRIEIRSLARVFIPVTLTIGAILYLVTVVALPAGLRITPSLSLGHLFLGDTLGQLLGYAYALAGIAVGVGAYSQVVLLLRTLAADGILPRPLAAADAQRPRRIMIATIALTCAAAALFMGDLVGVGTMLVLAMAVSTLLTMLACAIRGRKILRQSTLPRERRDGRSSQFTAALIALLALSVVLTGLLIQPNYTGIAALSLAIPTGVLLLIRRGRGKIGTALAAHDISEGRPLPTRVHAIVLVERLDRPTLQAITYVRATRPSTLAGLVVDVDPRLTERLVTDWETAELPVELRILGTPRGAARRPVIDHVRSLRTAAPRDIVIIYAPRVVSPSALWQRFFVRHSTPALLSELKLEPGVIVAEVPYHVEDVEDS